MRRQPEYGSRTSEEEEVEPWEEIVIDLISIFLSIVIVLLIISAILTACVIVAGVIMAMKDSKRMKQFEELPGRIIDQAAAGLKKREECNENIYSHVYPEQDPDRVRKSTHGHRSRSNRNGD